jgi:DNA-binding response OmpR family regulator
MWRIGRPFGRGAFLARVLLSARPFELNPEGSSMTRVLLIDGDRTFAQATAMSCMNDGIAVRLAETLCEGVRYMLDGAISAVLIDATLMRLSPSDQVQLFDAVAPGVPVVVLVPPGTTMDEMVQLQVRGFQVVPKPVTVQDVLAKVHVPVRSVRARPGAARQVEALCG